MSLQPIWLSDSDPPPNLRSYIQSRGRARKAESKLVMVFPETGEVASVEKWNNLEEEMKALYMEDMCETEEILALEQIVEHSDRLIHVTSTGYATPHFKETKLTDTDQTFAVQF